MDKLSHIAVNNRQNIVDIKPIFEKADPAEFLSLLIFDLIKNKIKIYKQKYKKCVVFYVVVVIGVILIHQNV